MEISWCLELEQYFIFRKTVGTLLQLYCTYRRNADFLNYAVCGWYVGIQPLMVLICSDRHVRRTFIYSKYRDHIYCHMHPLHADQAALNAVSIVAFSVAFFPDF